MNLAIHGLEGDIRHGGHINSYYDDPHEAVGKFDFVLANPPFNVNAVDKDRLASDVGTGRRFPFGVPRTDNANYLWIQLFYSSLNSTGRAGFVMAGGAESAGASEKEIRKQLIESRAVDVIVAVGPKMFYTVTLGCVLWFFDRAKQSTPRGDKVLFLDARHIFRQVDRAHRDWTNDQVRFLAEIVRNYRGEERGENWQPSWDEITLPVQLKDEFRAAFKEGRYVDIPGFCRQASLSEIAEKGHTLQAGTWVGVTPGEEVSDENFKEKLEALNEELENLNTQARELEATIAANVVDILEV